MDDQYPLTGSLERNGVYIVWKHAQHRDTYVISASDLASRTAEGDPPIPCYNNIVCAQPAMHWIDPDYRKVMIGSLEEQLIKRRGKQ